MEDQIELVTYLRQALFPQLYQPGHEEANADGWLRLDRVGPHVGNLQTGLERGALWAKHLAWNLRGAGAGVVKAKPGSENAGGATADYPQGFTTDIVATSNGAHWDFQQDSAAGGYPQWNALPHTIEHEGTVVDLWAPIVPRFVAAFDPATQLVEVNEKTGEVTPMPRATWLWLFGYAAERD